MPKRVRRTPLDLEYVTKHAPVRVKQCAVGGCELKHYAKNFCKKHYYRLMRNGTTMTQAHRKNKTGDFRTWSLEDFIDEYARYEAYGERNPDAPRLWENSKEGVAYLVKASSNHFPNPEVPQCQPSSLPEYDGDPYSLSTIEGAEESYDTHELHALLMAMEDVSTHSLRSRVAKAEYEED